MPKSLILTLLEEQDEERALKKKLREVVMALADVIPWKFEPVADKRFIRSQTAPKYSHGFTAENPDDKLEKVAVGIWQSLDWDQESQRTKFGPKQVEVVYSFLRPHAHENLPRSGRFGEPSSTETVHKLTEALKKFNPRTRAFYGIAALEAHAPMMKDLQERLVNHFYAIET